LESNACRFGVLALFFGVQRLPLWRFGVLPNESLDPGRLKFGQLPKTNNYKDCILERISNNGLTAMGRANEAKVSPKLLQSEANRNSTKLE
jgi:hypothetical protein